MHTSVGLELHRDLSLTTAANRFVGTPFDLHWRAVMHERWEVERRVG